MLRNKWLYVHFNLAILFVIILMIYLAISLTKYYPNFKLNLINNLKSKLLFDKMRMTECERENLLNPNFNSAKEAEHCHTSQFQFKTVEDAWNKDNIRIPPYINDGYKTALSIPNFQVLCIMNKPLLKS